LTCDKGSLARVSVNRRIYSFCGGDGIKCFSDVEMFDPVHGKWIKNQPMLKKGINFYHSFVLESESFSSHTLLKHIVERA
jgi:hypothetical protein